jgi:hypothetical protein
MIFAVYPAARDASELPAYGYIAIILSGLTILFGAALLGLALFAALFRGVAWLFGFERQEAEASLRQGAEEE